MREELGGVEVGLSGWEESLNRTLVILFLEGFLV